MKKTTSDFYLLKQKSIHEGDLFVVDYIATKRSVIKLQKQVELMQLKLDALKSDKNKLHLVEVTDE